MEKVIFIGKDWKAPWSQEELNRLQDVDGVIHEAPIDHLIDMNMLVKGPEEMADWLAKNAIQLWDIGSIDDIGFEDGKVYVKLPGLTEWKELTEELVEQTATD